jgi:hypothetical protein
MAAAAGPSLLALVGPAALILIDTGDPDRPVVAGQVPLPGATSIGIVRAEAGQVLVATEEPAPGNDPHPFTSVYYLDVIDVSDPHAPRVTAKVTLPGAPLAMGDGVLFSRSDQGALSFDRIDTSAGRLTSIGGRAGNLGATAAIEGTRAIVGLSGVLEVIDLSAGGASVDTALVGSGNVIVAALAGGRAVLSGGEVFDVRTGAPRFAALLPRDPSLGLPGVKVELSSATGRPIRAYFPGGYRGIQSLSLD